MSVYISSLPTYDNARNTQTVKVEDGPRPPSVDKDVVTTTYLGLM